MKQKNETAARRILRAKDFDAAIFDLDGVVTRTARIHAHSWKRLFDDYLRKRSERTGEPFRAFDVGSDYPQYVDGKPRFDGVESFLRSRGIELPRGDPEDRPERETIHGLGARKNDYFLRYLKEEGVEVFDSSVRLLRALRRSGLKTALVSSSRNATKVLEAAGATKLFDTVVDGVKSARLGLKGKPAPDIFLRAATELGVSPARAVMFEDAISGVEAGRAGRFGLVVGVDRRHQPEMLRKAGADVVVPDLAYLKISRGEKAPGAVEVKKKDALANISEIEARISGRRVAVLLDYDGTLTPIVARPDLALLSEETRAILRGLARVATVAIISGRDLADVRALVGLDGLIYAGSHGFDISGPRDLRLRHEEGVVFESAIQQAAEKLRAAVGGIEGALVEGKKFAVAVHYRQVDEANVPEIEAAVDKIVRDLPELRKTLGKKVFELRPRLDWDKGKALLWLLEALDENGPDVVPFYFGDDITDEDGFRALQDRGITIYVGRAADDTAAGFVLRNPAEVRKFLSKLIQLLQHGHHE